MSIQIAESAVNRAGGIVGPAGRHAVAAVTTP